MQELNLNINANSDYLSESDQTIDLNDLANMISTQQNVSVDEAMQMLQNGEIDLNVTIEGVDTVNFDFDDQLNGTWIDFDRLDITDNAASDVTVMVADSDGMVCDRVVELTDQSATDASGQIDGGSIYVADSNADGLTEMTNRLRVENSQITEGDEQYFNIDTGIDANDNVAITSSRIEVKSHDTDLNHQMNNNYITKVHFDLNVNSTRDDFKTDVAYDVDYDMEIDVSTAEVAQGLEAGIELFVNHTKNNQATTDAFNMISDGDDMNVNVHSTIGDTQAEAFINQFQSFAQTDEAVDVDFDWQGQTYTIDQLLNILGDSDHQLHQQLITSLVDGQDSGSPVLMNNYLDNSSTSSRSWDSVTAGALTGHNHDGMAVAQDGITRVTQTTTVTSKVVVCTVNDQDQNVDDYQLTFGRDRFEETTTTTSSSVLQSWCRFCDPVAVINIDSLGGTGSLAATTENTAELGDFVGGDSIIMDNVANDQAVVDQFQFRTGVRISDDSSVDVVSSKVNQDVQAIGRQTAREGVEMTGGVYNDAGKQIDEDDSSYTTADLLTTAFDTSSWQTGTGVIDEFMTLLRQQGDGFDITDPSTWSGDFCQTLQQQQVVLQNSFRTQIADMYTGQENGHQQISAANAANTLDATFTTGTAEESVDVQLIIQRIGFQMDNSQESVDLVASFVSNLTNGQDSALFNMVRMGQAVSIAAYMESEISNSLAVTLVDDLGTPDSKVADVINECSDAGSHTVINALVRDSVSAQRIGRIVGQIAVQHPMDYAIDQVKTFPNLGENSRLNQVADGLGDVLLDNVCLQNSIAARIGRGGSGNNLMLEIMQTDYGNSKTFLDDLLEDHTANTMQFIFTNLGDKQIMNTYVAHGLSEGSQQIYDAMSSAMINFLQTGHKESGSRAVYLFVESLYHTDDISTIVDMGILSDYGITEDSIHENLVSNYWTPIVGEVHNEVVERASSGYFNDIAENNYCANVQDMLNDETNHRVHTNNTLTEVWTSGPGRNQ